MPHPELTSKLIRGALLAGSFAVVLSSHAQPGSPAAAAPGQDETIVLSPFVVTADNGWSANDTLSATRTKQALKDVPVSIDAITADFIADLDLRSADDVAGYVSNVYAAPIMENANEKGNFSFRGLTQTNNVSRNYFRWYIPSDSYNIERLDFGKGSNSLIFGEVEPGGNGAAFTKRPLMKNFSSLRAITGSEGAYRFEADVNLKIRDGLALRVNAVRRLDRTFQDASDYKFEAFDVALLWQPTRQTSIRLEYERGAYQSGRGFQGIQAFEQSAKGLGFTSTGTYFTSDNKYVFGFSGTGGIPSIDRGSSNGPAGGEPSLLEGRFIDVQLRNAAGTVVGTKRINGFPKSYNIRGSFDDHSRPFHDFSATIEQQLGPINTELSYNYQFQEEERNDNSFDNSISVDVNGRPSISSSLDRKSFANRVHALRGSAVYKFDQLSWMEQTFVAGWEYRLDQVLNLRTQWFNTYKFDNGLASSVNPTNDRARLRIYLDDPQFYSRALFDRMQADRLPDTANVTMKPLHYFASGSTAADGTELRKAFSYSLLSSGSYFKGRLLSLIGARFDAGRTFTYNALRHVGVYNEDIPPPDYQGALPGEYVEDSNLHKSNTSSTAGLTYRLTPDINAYAVYSESFRFQGVNTFDRTPIGPIAGTTKEVGLKGSMFNNRATFTVGVFDIDRANVVLNWRNILTFTDTDVEDLLNPNNVLPGDPGYKHREPGTASASRNYTAQERSKGFDVTFMVRPMDGLQVRLTLGKVEVQSTPDLKNFRGYYDAAVTRTTAASAPGGNPLLIEDPGVLSRAKFLLDTLDIVAGATGARGSPWSGSWIVDYSFSKDSAKPLQGVRVGVNGVWRTDYLFAQVNGVDLKGGGSHLLNAYVMRDQKIFGRQVRLRAGVKGLVDLSNRDKIRSLGFTTILNGSNILTYGYVIPPQYSFEATVRF